MVDTKLLKENGLHATQIKEDCLHDASLILSKLANIQYLGLGERNYIDGEETLESVKNRLNRYQEALVQLQCEARNVLKAPNTSNVKGNTIFDQAVTLSSQTLIP